MANLHKSHWFLALFLVAFISIGALRTGFCAQGQLDPLTLLQGVESARLQIPPSSLTLKFIHRDPLSSNETVMVVDFDGELRGFENKRVDATNATWATVFDGSKAITYEERLENVEYRSLTSPRSMFLFDPRTLGLTHAYTWVDTLNLLPIRWTNGTLELVGPEEINGVSVWHISFQFTGGRPVDRNDYWIDDKHGFRVLRKDVNGIQTFSFYENSNYTELPSRVVSKAYARLNPAENETPMWEREVQVLEAKANVKFPKDRWGLAGMKMKPGTSVLNHEPAHILGVWDGRGMVPEFDQARRTPAWSYVVMALVIILPPIVILGIQKMRRRKQA